MTFDELGEVRWVVELEVGGDARDGLAGVSQQAADFQGDPFVEDLLGGLAGDLLARPVEGAGAVSDLPGEISDAGPLVQPLLDDRSERQIGLRELADAARGIGHLDDDPQQQRGQERPHELDTSRRPVEAVLFASKLLDPPEGPGQQVSLELPARGGVTTRVPRRSFGVGAMGLGRPHHDVCFEDGCRNESLHLTWVDVQQRPDRHSHGFEVDDVAATTGGAQHQLVEGGSLPALQLPGGDSGQEPGPVDNLDRYASPVAWWIEIDLDRCPIHQMTRSDHVSSR